VSILPGNLAVRKWPRDPSSHGIALQRGGVTPPSPSKHHQMALIVICGLPCSGKSTVAAALSKSLEAALDPSVSIVVVDEPSLHLHDRNESYKNAACEKRTRGQLKSAVERSLSKQPPTYVILDSLNCIKGYRYELHCIAKSAGTRYCMVHLETPAERCRAMNQERELSATYSEAVFEDLAGRFERPDAKNRWDSPLFTIKGVGALETDAGIESCSLPVGPPLEEEQPLSTGEDEESEHGIELMVRSIVAAMTGTAPSKSKGGNERRPDDSSASHSQPEGARQKVSAHLTPSFATNSTPLLSTNTLHELDQALQDVIDKVSLAQQPGLPSSVSIYVKFMDDSSAALPSLQLHQPVSIAELRRHKRSFMKLATKVLFARLSDSSRAKLMFIEYLSDNIAGCELIKEQ
jgi:protein KTI12